MREAPCPEHHKPVIGSHHIYGVPKIILNVPVCLNPHSYISAALMSPPSTSTLLILPSIPTYFTVQKFSNHEEDQCYTKMCFLVAINPKNQVFHTKNISDR